MNRWITPLLITTSFIGIIFIGIWGVRQNMPSPNELAVLAQSELTKALKVPVTVKVAEVSLMGARLRHLDILSDKHSPTGYFLTLPDLQVRWSIWKLLIPSKQKTTLQAQVEQAVRKVIINNATIFLWRDRKGNWNFQPLLKAPSIRERKGFIFIRFNNSNLIIRDETLPLPNGSPFQIMLISNSGELTSDGKGLKLEILGKVQPPLGMNGSKAILSLRQTFSERTVKTKGKLSLTNINIFNLPEQIRLFLSKKLQVNSGIIANGKLSWKQIGKKMSVAMTLRGSKVKLNWQDSQTQNFQPADVMVNAIINMTGKTAGAWQVSINTLSRHPQFGEGRLVAERKQDYLFVRWRGNYLPITTVQKFAPTIPLHNGVLNGEFTSEQVNQTSVMEADLTATQTSIVIRNAYIPKMSTQFVKLNGRLERFNKKWKGNLIFQLKNPPTFLTATGRLNNDEGRLQVEVDNFPLHIVEKSLATRLNEGFVSGKVNLNWSKNLWTVENASVHIHDQVDVSKKQQALSISSGQMIYGKNPIWKVKGELNTTATEKLWHWLAQTFNLPIKLIQGGEIKAHGFGAGKQWNLQASWNLPKGLFLTTTGQKWQVSTDRLTLLTAPRGGTVTLKTVQIQNAQLPFQNGLTLRLPETFYLQRWNVAWDTKLKSVTAEGEVMIPKAFVSGIPFHKTSAIAIIHATMSGKSQKLTQIQLHKLSCVALGGRLYDGNLIWDIEQGKAYGQIWLKDVAFSKLKRLTLKTLNQKIPETEGVWSGKLQFSLRSETEKNERSENSNKTKRYLILSAIGTGEGLRLQEENFKLQLEKLTLNTCGLQFKANDNNWRLQQFGAEGKGQGLNLELNGQRKLHVKSFLSQSLLELKTDGWRWEIKIPTANFLNGRCSGQARVSESNLEGHLSFKNVDAEQVTKSLMDFGLKADNHKLDDLPKGKLSGWLRWFGDKQTEGRMCDWESALSISDNSWQDWTAKLIGVRLLGRLNVDANFKNLQVTGKVDSFHLLSDNGQAVLNGKFTFSSTNDLNQTIPFFGLELEGKWGNALLSRLANRFQIPKPLNGIAKGNLKVKVQVKTDKDGQQKTKFYARGLAQTEAMAINETMLRKVSGSWEWDGEVIQLKNWQAILGERLVVGEGAINTTSPHYVALKLRCNDISLPNLMTALEGLDLPTVKGQLEGVSDWKIDLYKVENEWRAIIAAVGRMSRLDKEVLGDTRLDLTVIHELPDDEHRKAVTKVEGQLTAKTNKMTLTAKLTTTLPNWAVHWQGGKVPLSLVKALINQIQIQPKEETPESEKQKIESESQSWRKWLESPLDGEIWTEGKADGRGEQITNLTAQLYAPQLLGIGGEPNSLRLNIDLNESGWKMKISELRQNDAIASGWVSVDNNGKLRGEIQTQRLPKTTIVNTLRLLKVSVGEEKLLPDGFISAEAQLKGTNEHPQVTGKLMAESVHWHGWWLPKLAVRKFLVQNKTLQLEKGDVQLIWGERLPSALVWGNLSLDEDRTIQMRMELPRLPLTAVLPEDVPFKLKNGWLEGHFQLNGTMANPKLEGELIGEAKAVFIDDIKQTPPLLTSCKWHILADGKTAHLKEFTANLNGGELKGEGSFLVGENGLQDLFSNEGQLVMQIRNANLSLDDTPVNLSDATFEVKLKSEGLLVSFERLNGNGFTGLGKVFWRKEDLAKNQKSQKLMDKANWWLSNGNWNIALYLNSFRWQTKEMQGKVSGSLSLRTDQGSTFPSLSGRLTVHDGNLFHLPIAKAKNKVKLASMPNLPVSVTVEVGKNLFLRNPQATVLLGGEIFVSGDLKKPHIEGKIHGQRGNFRLPGSIMTLTDMDLTFAYAVDPLTEQWEGSARLRVEGEAQMDVHRILFTVSGPVDERSQRLGILPTVTMLATPPLPQQTLLERMFGFGLTQISNALTDLQQLFSGALVQSFMGDLLAPVTSSFAEALRLTELSVIREQQTGKRWLRLGIPLGQRLHVLWRQGLSPTDPSALEVQYFLGKRTSVTWIKTERERAELRLQTSVRF